MAKEKEQSSPPTPSDLYVLLEVKDRDKVCDILQDPGDRDFLMKLALEGACAHVMRLGTPRGYWGLPDGYFDEIRRRVRALAKNLEELHKRLGLEAPADVDAAIIPYGVAGRAIPASVLPAALDDYETALLNMRLRFQTSRHSIRAAGEHERFIAEWLETKTAGRHYGLVGHLEYSALEILVSAVKAYGGTVPGALRPGLEEDAVRKRVKRAREACRYMQTAEAPNIRRRWTA